jgi:hypothetical protein
MHTDGTDKRFGIMDYSLVCFKRKSQQHVIPEMFNRDSLHREIPDIAWR